MGILLKKWPCELQHDASDCAAAIVSTVLLRYKQEMTITKIREIIGTDSYGTTVKGIVAGLEKLHFNVKAIRTKTDEITSDLTFPAIAQIKTSEGLNHFVVIHKVTKSDKLIIADPSKGLHKCDREEFDNLFTGVVIFMVPTSEFEMMRIKDQGMLDLFLKLILPQKKLLAVIILASVLLTAIGIFSSFFSKIVMDEIIPYGLKESLYVFLIVFGVVSFLQNLLSYFRQHVLLYLSRKVDIPVLMGYYNHIIRLPYKFFGTRRIGDIITRFQDAMTIKEIFTTASISLVLDLALALISSLLLYNLNPKLFMILLVMVLINIVLIYIFKKPYKKINYEQMEAGASLNAHLIESIRNINTVKAHGAENEQLSKLETKFVRSLKIGYKEGILQNTQGFVSTLVNSIGNILMLGVGALFIMDGEISIGDLLVFQTLSQFFIEPVQNLVSLQLTFQEAQIAMKRLSELMSLNREDSEKGSKLTDIELKKDIHINNITFAYGSRAPVLKDFNLHIPQGEKIALVGESGAGKSTIAKLLLNFMEVQQGDIKIGEYNISDIDLQYLRKRVAYIPQNIELFTGTVIENLKVGDPLAKYEDIVNACKIAGAAEFIEKMQNKYQSLIEEGGGNLSGGEKQRLAIARALLAKSDFYIFDEATSNLDSFSERKIQEVIFEKIKNKTTIIIAHRLSTIIRCDKIYFIENGTVAQSGTHEELMSLKGKYYELVKNQTVMSTSADKIDKDIARNDDDNEVFSYE
ncbi:peptidase domain-containing ABC transporter [Bacillus sp. S1-R1J2-FB]|uniref:peptidase domain-containing ABC transporter n=1 Tax=Bacillus sp. S1-R1J2-FB TaxID=1973494 RepID=UPI000A3CC8B4|nr:peptidase domain-containing ABC transporter [Bacillus sp. S1-R1J2-FB]